MAIIVVGGSGKDVGKTALVCGLIAALSEFRWTAVKITSHRYGGPESIVEETEPGQGTDTARYLAAGAHRALLVTSQDGKIPLQELWRAVGDGADLIFESNSIAAQLRPDLCLGVLGPGWGPGRGMGLGSGGSEAADKPSFEPFMRRVDAIVALDSVNRALGPAERLTPVFPLAHLERGSPEMLAWVRARLHPAPHS